MLCDNVSINHFIIIILLIFSFYFTILSVDKKTEQNEAGDEWIFEWIQRKRTFTNGY